MEMHQLEPSKADVDLHFRHLLKHHCKKDSAKTSIKPMVLIVDALDEGWQLLLREKCFWILYENGLILSQPSSYSSQVEMKSSQAPSFELPSRVDNNARYLSLVQKLLHKDGVIFVLY